MNIISSEPRADRGAAVFDPATHTMAETPFVVSDRGHDLNLSISILEKNFNLKVGNEDYSCPLDAAFQGVVSSNLRTNHFRIEISAYPGKAERGDVFSLKIFSADDSTGKPVGTISMRSDNQAIETTGKAERA